ncbi:hypothetical protein [Deefgea sp. CFH1-16]|uniref:hypothetical protein n=1 Tax=Deefgea sp. CFH1-16 TaxID=2675457 RepID=UPI0015F39071|nr:hypothetical protein [Deefgea sp. CFH1-16]MBM5575840.1 hypothetical protein [Deefgea sp. CFH1-16]
MGIIDSQMAGSTPTATATPQPSAQPSAAPSSAAPDFGDAVLKEANSMLSGAGKDAVLGRFGDGEGDVIDEVGETAAQITRSVVKTLANEGMKLVPPQQAEALALIKDMLLELCMQHKILKEADSVQNRRLAAAAAAKYFKKFNQQEAQRPAAAPANSAPQAEPQGAM